MPTAAHVLELLSLDADSGARRSAQAMSFAVPTLALAELALRGRLGVRDDVVVVLDPSPTGVALLDRELSAVQAERPRKPRALVPKLRRGADTSVLEELAALDAVRPQTGKALGLFPVKQYLPNPDAAYQSRTTTLAEVHALDPSPQALLLAWGARIGRLEKQLLGDDYRQTRARVEQLSERMLPEDVVALLRGGLKAREASEAAAAAG